jgi:DNA-binding GntR family transcriptional regulator
MLLPGTRLSEEAIAEEFSVSRSPVREATTKLELIGLADRLSLRERRVATPTARFIRETYETWVLLSTGRAFVSSQAASPEDRAALIEVVESMEAHHAAERHDEVTKLSGRFHSLMRAPCSNAQLHNVLGDFEKYRKWLVNIYLKPSPLPPDELARHREQSMMEHRLIADAFVAADLVGLMQAIQAHTYRQRDRVLDLAERRAAFNYKARPA